MRTVKLSKALLYVMPGCFIKTFKMITFFSSLGTFAHKIFIFSLQARPQRNFRLSPNAARDIKKEINFLYCQNVHI